MNTFRVEIKKDGEWVALDATPVFPLRWCELLDERLDEAYLNTINDSTPVYEPTTEMRIIAGDGTKEQTRYFIVANDKGERFPVWSSKYRHEIYLIERTKLLEGVYCSALTFTNPLERAIFSQAPAHIISAKEKFTINGFRNGFPEYSCQWFPSKANVGTVLELPSRYEFMEDLYNALELYGYDLFYPMSTQESRGDCSYYIQNANGIIKETENSKPDKTRESITIDSDTVVVYTIRYFVGEGPTACFRCQVTFYIEAVFGEKNISDEKKTITDVINRILGCAEPREIGSIPRYRLDGVEYDEVGYPKSSYVPDSAAERFSHIVAPEFTLSEGTLREQLKVIGSFIHGEVWLDDDDVIHYKDYGETQKCKLADKPFVYDSFMHDINSYCTDIRSKTENLVSALDYAQGVVYDPSDRLYKSIRSTTEYTRIEESTGVVKTGYNIYKVLSVYCGVINEEDTGYYIRPCDITNYVHESTAYNTLFSGQDQGLRSKAWAIHYKYGTNTLDGLFYRAPKSIEVFKTFAISNILSVCNEEKYLKSNIQSYLEKHFEKLVFQVVYQPISSVLLSHSKQFQLYDKKKFTQVYNQTENLVESSWFGENIKGAAARLGNVERTRVYLLNSLLDIPETGEIIDGYSITAVSVEFNPNHIKCTIGMSKDFNKISEYVGISSEKRLFEVSERNVCKREILLHETLVIGSDPIKGNRLCYTWFQSLSPFKQLFWNSNDERCCRISLALWTVGNINNSSIAILSNIFFSVAPRALGNTISLSFEPKDNYSAGESTLNLPGDEEIAGLWNSDTRYTDNLGHTELSAISLYSNPILDSADVEVNQAFSFPKAEPSAYETFADPLFSSDGSPHILDKDNREIPSYTIELEIKTTYSNLYIGSGLAKNCRLVSFEDISNRHACMYLIKKANAINKFTQYIDTTETDTFLKVGNVEVDHTVDERYAEETFRLATMSGGEVNVPYYGWVIALPSVLEVDSEGNQTIKRPGDVLLFKDEQWTGSKTLIGENELYFYYIHD